MTEPLLTRENTRNVLQRKAKIYLQTLLHNLTLLLLYQTYGEEGYKVCKPLCIPKDELIKVKHEKDHHFPFCDTFQSKILKVIALHLSKQREKPKPLSFSPSVQHTVESCYNVEDEESCTQSVICSRQKKIYIYIFLTVVQHYKSLLFQRSFHVFMSESTNVLTLYDKESSAGYEPICSCEDEDVQDNNEFSISYSRLCQRKKNRKPVS